MALPRMPFGIHVCPLYRTCRSAGVSWRVHVYWKDHWNIGVALTPNSRFASRRDMSPR